MKPYTPLPSKGLPGWFEIPGYSRYAANALGQILSKKTGRPTYGGNAGRYLKVSVYRDGDLTPSMRYVHDLIARAFHGEPERGMVVLHGDNDRRNNTPTNLAWGTQSRNIQQVYIDGLKFSHRYGANYPERWGHRLSQEHLTPAFLDW